MLYARRKGWSLAGIEVAVRHEGAREGGRDRIEVAMSFGGELTPDQAAQVRAVSQRCPVHRMLTSGADITHH